MKKLILVRHAKSSWEDENLDDFNRPLSTRGEYSSNVMKSFIDHKIDINDFNIFSSNAIRAKATTDIIFNNQKVTLLRELYTFEEKDLLKWLKRQKNKKNTIIIGHNPALINLINLLCKNDILNFPTCAVCQVNLNIDSWSDIKKNIGNISYLQKVKDLKEYNYHQ